MATRTATISADGIQEREVIFGPAGRRGRTAHRHYSRWQNHSES